MERRPKILLADDDPDLLEMYREVLAQLPSQPEIHTAISGAREDFAGGRRSRLAGDVPGSPGAVAQPARDPYRHLRRACDRDAGGGTVPVADLRPENAQDGRFAGPRHRAPHVSR